MALYHKTSWFIVVSQKYQNEVKFVNNDIRYGKPIPPEKESIISSLDSAIARSHVDTDTVVWRGMQDDMPMKVGEVFEDKGFMSVSFNRNVAVAFSSNLGNSYNDNNVVMRIPKDQDILSVNLGLGGHSRFMGEQEGVLPRGMKLRYVGLDSNARQNEKVFEVVK